MLNTFPTTSDTPRNVLRADRAAAAAACRRRIFLYRDVMNALWTLLLLWIINVVGEHKIIYIFLWGKLILLLFYAVDIYCILLLIVPCGLRVKTTNETVTVNLRGLLPHLPPTPSPTESTLKSNRERDSRTIMLLLLLYFLLLLPAPRSAQVTLLFFVFFGFFSFKK